MLPQRFPGKNNSFVGLIDVRKCDFTPQERGNISDTFGAHPTFSAAVIQLAEPRLFVGSAQGYASAPRPAEHRGACGAAENARPPGKREP